MSRVESCGYCCGIFSTIAIIFLVVMSSVIRSGSHAINIEASKRDSAANGCITAAIIYGVFLVLSLGCCVYAKRTEDGKEQQEMLPLGDEDEYMAGDRNQV
eukprot:TRINITY_DN603_c0_g1_i3.p1 TRINITY_DN603_c0_g1~~TRINITY_DN603_c0_g1_i3.p1  ORF type:complete len:101 (+),score=39.85 TRINITY_DN603_c0_g1_i3:72-374(+)